MFLRFRILVLCCHDLFLATSTIDIVQRYVRTKSEMELLYILLKTRLYTIYCLNKIFNVYCFIKF